MLEIEYFICAVIFYYFFFFHGLYRQNELIAISEYILILVICEIYLNPSTLLLLLYEIAESKTPNLYYDLKSSIV